MFHKLTRKQEREVLNTLASNIRSQVGTDLSMCCGDDDLTISAVQHFMKEVAYWMVKAYPGQRYVVNEGE